jgi:hypothetical protein
MEYLGLFETFGSKLTMSMVEWQSYLPWAYAQIENGLKLVPALNGMERYLAFLLGFALLVLGRPLYRFLEITLSIGVGYALGLFVTDHVFVFESDAFSELAVIATCVGIVFALMLSARQYALALIGSALAYPIANMLLTAAPLQHEYRTLATTLAATVPAAILMPVLEPIFLAAVASVIGALLLGWALPLSDVRAVLALAAAGAAVQWARQLNRGHLSKL